MPGNRLTTYFLTLLFWSVTAAVTAATPADHSLVGRYEGSDLVGHKHSDFDEANLVNGPIVEAASGEDNRVWLHVEGVNDPYYYYKLPDRCSSLFARSVAQS